MARRSPAKPLEANERLNVAYLLKESFGQLWNYRSEASEWGQTMTFPGPTQE